MVVQISAFMLSITKFSICKAKAILQHVITSLLCRKQPGAILMGERNEVLL